MRPPISPGPAVAATAASCGKAMPGFAHGARDQPIEDLDMGARGDLRHDAAKRRVPLELAEQRLGQHPAPAVDQRYRGLVAAGLDAEHDRRPIHARTFLHDRSR